MGQGKPVETHSVVQSRVRTFDSIVGPDYACDLVKIDVEGHELPVLRGMRGTLERSPSVAVLLENFDRGRESALRAFFDPLGLSLYRVTDNARLLPLTEASTRDDWCGYLLATREQTLEGRLSRNWFRVDPGHLRLAGSSRVVREDGVAAITGDNLMFFGPYGHLPRGHWRFKLNGTTSGPLSLELTERVGLKVLQMEVDGANPTRDIWVDHDLVAFEIVARARKTGTTVELRNYEFERRT